VERNIDQYRNKDFAELRGEWSRDYSRISKLELDYTGIDKVVGSSKVVELVLDIVVDNWVVVEVSSIGLGY
jgi:hypothetical protein